MELLTPAPLLERETAADGRTCNRVRVPGWASTTGVGLPDLPVRGVLLRTPPSGTVEVDVEESSWHSIPGLTVPLVGAPGARDEFEGPAETAVALGESHPAPPFELSPRATVRGVPVMRLMLRPFRWDPATGELRYPASMIVRVRYGEPLTDAPPAPEAGAASGGGGPPPGTHVRMEVRQEGFYRVTGDDLREAGANLRAIDPATLRVFNRGREVAIRVAAHPRRLMEDDFFEFFGEALDSVFTDTNVYWLRWGGRRGRRFGVTDGTPPPGGEEVFSFPDTARFEENHQVWDTMPGAPEEDYWFWKRLTAPTSSSHSLFLRAPADVTANASLRVTLRGRTSGSHLVRVVLNGDPLGEDSWTGDAERVLEIPVPQSLLAAGANDLTLVLPGGGGVDQVYLNRVELAYERTAEAVGNELRLTLPEGEERAVLVGGLTAPEARVFDVSDPLRPRLLAGAAIAPAPGGAEVRFGVGAGAPRTFWVVGDAAVRTPSRVERRRTRHPRPASGADYILVTPRAFLPATRPLRALRREQGMRVKAVAIENIIDAYGWGIPDPAALKRFLREAYRSWERPEPAYVFLLGDANFDYRDHFALGKENRVPTHLSATAELGITPDDNWYASVDGDDELPDLFIGRVTVGSPEAAAQVVDKIVRYERQTPPTDLRALFVADNNEALYAAVAEELLSLLPRRVDPRRIYLPDYTDFALARQDLLDAIDEGALLTTYVGHGDITGWAGERLIETATVPLLDNPGRLTFAVNLDCLSGFFAHPSYYSVAERLVNLPGGGAIASFAASGLGYTWEHRMLGERLFALAFTGKRPTLGSMTTRAKLHAHARGATLDLVRTFTLLGDPATRLSMPEWR